MGKDEYFNSVKPLYKSWHAFYYSTIYQRNGSLYSKEVSGNLGEFHSNFYVKITKCIVSNNSSHSMLRNNKGSSLSFISINQLNSLKKVKSIKGEAQFVDYVPFLGTAK